jgi:hypothetical protein
MNERLTIQDRHRKAKLYRRPIGARIQQFHQVLLVCQRDDLGIPSSLGLQVIKIGLDGERFCVRLFETAVEEVA